MHNFVFPFPHIWMPKDVDPRIVVVDMDDTLCDCTGEVAKLAGVDPARITDFHTEECASLSSEECKRLRALFDGDEYLRTVPFYPEAKQVIVQLREAGGNPIIISNTPSKTSAAIKIELLLSEIEDLREQDIIINVITPETRFEKRLPDKTFLLLDDSPYNVSGSTAAANIMNLKPYNVTPKAKELVAGKFVWYGNDLGASIAYSRMLLQSSFEHPRC